MTNTKRPTSSDRRIHSMRTEARLVIIGAGIAGCSAAYHLTRLGWRDILVIDKGPLFENDGSTSHAPGSMFLTNPSCCPPSENSWFCTTPAAGIG